MLGAHSTKPSIGLLAFRRFARHVSPLAAGACALRAAVGALPGAGEVVGLGHPAGRQRLARGATSDSVGDVGDGVGRWSWGDDSVICGRWSWELGRLVLRE